MSSFGPPGSGSPDDPYARPPGSPGGPPVDPTLPQWGPPPASDADPPTMPLWSQPPGGGAEPPTAPLGQLSGGYPPPGAGQPGGYPPPPGNQPGPGYPPPGAGQPVGYPPPLPGGDQPGAYPPPGAYPSPGPFPPAGPPAGSPGMPGPGMPGGQPAPGGPWGPPPPPGYGPGPVAPPAKRSGGRIALIIGLVVVLLLCPCLGLVGWGAWKAAEEEIQSAGPGASPSASVSESGTPTATPTRAQPSPSKDGKEFAVGDCVVNDGTDSDAELRKVPCGPDTYEVLLRIPATTNGDRCKSLAPESTANYVHDNPIDLRDYVLCLKERQR